MPLTIIGSRFYMSRSPRDFYVGLCFDRPSLDGIPRGEPVAGDYTRELTRFVYSDDSAELSNSETVHFQAVTDWGVMSYVVVSQVPSGSVFGYQVIPPQVMSAGTVLEIDVGDLILGTGTVSAQQTSSGGGATGEHFHTWGEVTGKPNVFPPQAEMLSLNQLVDVSTSGVINGQVLGFNGSTWGPVVGGGGAGANEVYVGTSAPTDPDVELWYDEDAVSSGGGGGGGSTAWADITGKPSTFTPTPQALDWLTDVDVSGPSTWDSIIWTGAAWTRSKPVLADPPDVGGVYQGNLADPPPGGAGQNGPPWLRMVTPYTAADDNSDVLQIFSLNQFATEVKTTWFNGNGELRSAPSLQQRIAFRVFEHHQAGGNSTQRFFEASTNPTNTANREPLLGVYGTSHSTQPGWAVATRVLAGLLGVRAGGDYNGLSALNFRGFKTTAGAPTTGTWVLYDALIDSTGALYVCTTAGTPGSWVTTGKWLQLTQAAYDAIGTKDPNTLYVVVG